MCTSSPFKPASTFPGHGIISTTLDPLSTPALLALSYTYPLKLISPSTSLSSKSLLVFLLTYGGGLVAGDNISLAVNIKACSRLSLVTQGSTKIFKSPDPSTVTTQTLDVRIEAGGALCYLPDPVQPFADSVYEQRQTFRMGKAASLCVLDWVSEGRRARNESWDLESWQGRNEIWQTAQAEGRDTDVLLLRDNLFLNASRGTCGLPGESLAQRMTGLGVFGTLILSGELFADLGSWFVQEFTRLPRLGAKVWAEEDKEVALLGDDDRWRDERQARERSDGLLWTAAKMRGLVVVKFGAREVEGGRRWLKCMLTKEGTVLKLFGEGSMLCLG